MRQYRHRRRWKRLVVRVELDPAEIEVLGWLFDIHLGEKGAIPCFGLQVPHVYVPISEIFISVYNDCKKILGVTAAQDSRTHKSGRAMRRR